jgi:hypothetical protein
MTKKSRGQSPRDFASALIRKGPTGPASPFSGFHPLILSFVHFLGRQFPFQRGKIPEKIGGPLCVRSGKKPYLNNGTLFTTDIAPACILTK